jgi:hypothetical protein
MPVTKYRAVADMPRFEKRSEVDLAARIRTLWARAFLLCPPAPPRGVRRFRSIEEANEARSRWTSERMRRTST